MEETNFKNYVLELLKRGLRTDGRKSLTTYRTPIEIKLNMSNKAEGSAQVRLDNTIVIAGVKMEVGTPYQDSPDEGNIIVGAEFTPFADEHFEPGPPNEKAIQLSRLVDRAIRESKMIDLKKLCIKKGEEVWNVLIDIYVLNHDGNMLDAACLAAVAALNSACLPGYKDGRADYENRTKKKLPITCLPITCTVFKIGDKLLLDPNKDEEDVMDDAIAIGVTKDGNIHSLQKLGNHGFSKDELFKACEIVINNSNQLRSKIFKG